MKYPVVVDAERALLDAVRGVMEEVAHLEFSLQELERAIEDIQEQGAHDGAWARFEEITKSGLHAAGGCRVLC